MKYSSQLTDSCTVRKQHYCVCKMIYSNLLLKVVQYWCYLTSVLHLKILIMKNLWEYLTYIVACFLSYLPLGRIIQRHGLTCHSDDTQLYMVFKPSDVASKCNVIYQIEAYVADIWIWMNYNFLELSEDDKTELLIITTLEELSKIRYIDQGRWSVEFFK